MKKLTFIILGAFLFFVTPFVFATQEQVKSFPQEQKALEKASAIKEHRETSQKEKKSISEKMHQENLDFLKKKLAKNTRLTEAEKTELISHFERQYKENVSFRDQKYSEDVAFFEQIADNKTMTQEQKKAAIVAHFKEQKSETKKHRQEQKSENKTERKTIHSEIKTNTSVVSPKK